MRAGHWRSPTASTPVDAVVALPGSKSMTNRALALATLAEGTSLVRRPLRGRDTLLMAAGLTAMGAEVADAGEDWRVTPGPLRGGTAVDVGNAGTVMRFLPPVAALADGDVTFDGDPRSRERPLGPLLAALRVLGARIDDGGRGALPVTVRGSGRLTGGVVAFDASSSSQLISGLLLSAARYDKGVEVRHKGPPVPSAPHLAMTTSMLRTFGAEVETAPDVWRVAPGPLLARDVEIEPDLSNAAPFLAAALVTAGRVRIPGWPARTSQPGDALRGLLTEMGATCEAGPEGLTLRGSGTVHGLDADLHDVSELAPTLAALAALADGPSRLTGIAHMRRQETDRLAALAGEIGALGGDVRETPDGLAIRPRPLHGGVFHTYDDHRIATAAAVIGLAVPGVEVENIATTGKTLPNFVELWSSMLGEAH